MSNIVASVARSIRAPRARTKPPVKDWTTPEEHGGTDSIAIQAAIDTGLNVQCDGSYSIATSLSVTAKTGQSFFGSGSFRLDDSRPLGTQVFNLDHANKIRFHGLTFDGNKANQTQPPDDNDWNRFEKRTYFTPINIEASPNVEISGCEFYDVCTTSINFFESWFIRIEENHFHDSYMDAVFTNFNAPDYSDVVQYDVIIHRNLVERMTYRDSEGEVIHAYANGFLVDADDIVISWNYINQCDRKGTKPTDRPRNNILVENNTIINCGTGIGPQGGSNMIIRNNLITDSTNIGISISPQLEAWPMDNILIEDNTVLRSGGDPASSTYDGIISTKFSSNVTIRRNTVDESQRFGLYLVGVDTVLLEDNNVTNTGIRGINLEEATIGSNDVTILNNEVNNTPIGIAVWDMSDTVDIDGNTIEDCDTYGVYLRLPSNVTVQNNGIDRIEGNGVRVVSATTTILDNNTIDNCDNSGVLVSGTPESDDTTISNNDFDTIGQYGINIPAFATNIVIEANNTFTNIGVADINWPEEP